MDTVHAHDYTDVTPSHTCSLFHLINIWHVEFTSRIVVQHHPPDPYFINPLLHNTSEETHLESGPKPWFDLKWGPPCPDVGCAPTPPAAACSRA